MKIINIIIASLMIFSATGCRFNTKKGTYQSIELQTLNNVHCENMFVVGDKLVFITNSENYFFDYYLLPSVKYIGSFGTLSRNTNGFSMVPSPDLIRVLNDSSFVSDNRIITFASQPDSVSIDENIENNFMSNDKIDSMLNIKLIYKTGLEDGAYIKSNVTNSIIYSLYYSKGDNNIDFYKQTPELHVFDMNYVLLRKYYFTNPLISFAISAKYNKIYTLSTKNNTLQIYDL
ncbi:MAG: hypothetical protein RR388_05255 [Rikenellaceae bacterium]